MNDPVVWEPQDLPAEQLGLRIGTPERGSARLALSKHHEQKRIDKGDYQRRLAACDEATNQAELLRIFADLPAPHPALPRPAQPETPQPDSDLWEWAGILSILFGVPVAVVLGFTEDAWWTLAVPVVFCVLLVTVVAVIDRFRRR